jgi:glycosyltransferase involved in cell wall biosynthesis
MMQESAGSPRPAARPDHRQSTLNLFYEEPDPDRWLPFDRHPRRWIRRLVRGPAEPRGTLRAFLNLVEGLDRIGAPYRLNDFRHIAANGGELACVFGKPQILARIPPRTPILFGTSIYSHPGDDPGLPGKRPIRQVLVPSTWVQRMFEEVWPGIVTVWPVGIDTDRWAPDPAAVRDVDVVIYDKIFWERERHVAGLIEPLRRLLAGRNLRVETLRYGSYREQDLLTLSRRARSMVYLSRHETQGIAAQQMMSAGVPLFAWDRGGQWQDPKYFPQHVRFGPVTSVPYWSDACGVKFTGDGDLDDAFARFWEGVERGAFTPRPLVLEQLSLERQAAAYAALAAKYA